MNPRDEQLDSFPLWRKLVRIFRQHQAPLEETAEPESPPLGFATRVVSRWQELRQQEWVQRWERMSIRTAIGSCACAAVVGIYLFVTDLGNQSDDLLILPPTNLETFAVEE